MDVFETQYACTVDNMCVVVVHLGLGVYFMSPFCAAECEDCWLFIIHA